MGKNVHCINYANSNFTTAVTLLSDYEKMKPPQRFQNLTREKRSALLKKTVVYGSQNTVKRMSKYVAKKSQLWSNQSMHFYMPKNCKKNPLPNLAKKRKKKNMAQLQYCITKND